MISMPATKQVSNHQVIEGKKENTEDRKVERKSLGVLTGLHAGSQSQEMGFKSTRMDLGETGA